MHTSANIDNNMDDVSKMKSFARPNTGLSNLVNMVQTVIEEIDERR